MKHLRKINPNFIGASVVLLFLSALLGAAYLKERQSARRYIDYAAFMQAAGEGSVQSVTLGETSTLNFSYKNDESTYYTDNPRRENFKEELLLKGIEVEEAGQARSETFIQLGLSAAMAALALYMINRRNGRSAMKEGMRFAAVNSAGSTAQCCFDDIAGNAEAKESVADIVDYLKNPEKYTEYGARMPKGILLHGRPGTGKTLMARAMAGEAGVPFYAVSGSDFVQMYVGVGAARVRELFKKARDGGRAVIFIDEIDALGKKRSDINGSDEREQTLNALLTEMSGFNGGEGLVVVAATNRPDTLDDALLRPGRFDRRVEIALPDVNARRQILSLHAKNKPLSEKVDLDKLAGDTVFFSGAMLECLLNDAAINAAKRGISQISPEDIERAYYASIAGAEKKDRSALRKQERRVTAYHEAGHALAGVLAVPGSRVAKISIIPTAAGAGGFCVNIPQERMYYTKRELEQQIMVHLAGRAAEELTFGAEQVTTGASNDIEKATQTANQYVTRFGMCAEVGLLDISNEKTDETVLKNCRQLTGRLYGEVSVLLAGHSDLLAAVAEELLKKESLSGDELARIMEAYAAAA